MTAPIFPPGLPAYDTWGLSRIPSGTELGFTPLFSGWGQPAAGQHPANDPALAVLLDFLGCWLLTDGKVANAWGPVGGFSSEAVVRTVYLHDPKDCDFNTRALPALFMWRESAKQELVADDWERETTRVMALWVFPIKTDESFRLRQPFGHVLAKSIGAAIERGRTPTWIQPGDPDSFTTQQGPDGLPQGSLFWSYAGFESFKLEDWKKATIILDPNERSPTGARDMYPAIEFTFQMEEKLDYGLGRYPELLGADATIISETPVAFTLWAASTPYATGNAVVPVTPVPGVTFFYVCTTAGVSGTTLPTFPTTPTATVTDGQVVWTCVGLAAVVADAGPLSTT